MENPYQGINGNLILKENEILIERGVKGLFLGNDLQCVDITIPYKEITKVTFRQAHIFFPGYLSFDRKSKQKIPFEKIINVLGRILLFLFSPAISHYSISFNAAHNKNFEEAYSIIKNQIANNNETDHHQIMS